MTGKMIIVINCLACIIFFTSINSFAREPYFKQVDIFENGAEGYDNFRIPAVVCNWYGMVFAFCEGRAENADNGDIDVLMRRSLDNGKTWGPIEVVWDNGPNTCGNPCPVYDRDTSTIWLLMSHNLGHDHESEIIKGTGEGTRTVWVTKLHLAGDHPEEAVWSKPVNITKHVKSPNWTWYATGPGIGIHLTGGKLIVPCDHTVEGTMENESHIIYSDDHGETWELGGSTYDNFICEPQVVELADGRLLLNSRNWNPRAFFEKPAPAINHYRKIATSTNGGLSWSETYSDSVLVEPGCQASIIRHSTEEFHDKNRILFCNPASIEKREKLTVRISYDEGKTWPVSKIINSGYSGYSCLTVLVDGTIGCFYENGLKNGKIEKLSFALFNLEWLTDGADGFPEWE